MGPVIARRLHREGVRFILSARRKPELDGLARELVGSTEGAELFVYPGNEHLFSDSSLPSYDQAAADLLMRRVLDFLAGIR